MSRDLQKLSEANQEFHEKTTTTFLYEESLLRLVTQKFRFFKKEKLKSMSIHF